MTVFLLVVGWLMGMVTAVVVVSVFDMIEERVAKLEDHVNRLYGGLVLASILVPIALRLMEK